MKLAIHDLAGSFSDRWLEYCRTRSVDFKIVDCLSSDIIAEMRDCDGLMWHWSHGDYRAAQFARQLTHSLECMGKRVFPDSRTSWHYDDKVGQKYLLEALGAPLVPSHVFYDEPRALAWIDRAAFPEVFKLRRGAGSANVVLVKSKSRARKLVRRAFGRGFSPLNRASLLRDRLGRLRARRDFESLVGVAKGLARYIVPTDFERKTSRDRGYVYFQDFIPGNAFDTRIVVIGKRAFGIKRMVREGDFRASGSGLIRYAKSEIDASFVRSAFDISKRLGTQCLALDYISTGGRAYLTEISYAFMQSGYYDCPGFWDDELNWHEGRFCPEWFMIEDFIDSLNQRHETDP